MEVVTHDTHTDIRITGDEAKELCGICQGADRCIWLCVGGEGFECLYYNHRSGITLTGETLEGRWKAGKTVAKRNGCDKIRNLNTLLKVTRGVE